MRKMDNVFRHKKGPRPSRLERGPKTRVAWVVSQDTTPVSESRQCKGQPSTQKIGASPNRWPSGQENL